MDLYPQWTAKKLIYHTEKNRFVFDTKSVKVKGAIINIFTLVSSSPLLYSEFWVIV